MTDTETTTRAKRKRSQISYDVQEYFEDLDMEEHAAVDPDSSSAIDDSDVEDVDFGTRKVCLSSVTVSMPVADF